MPRFLLAAAVWILGMMAVALQSLALAARYFQPHLSADYIYPQLFAEDVLAGRYPLSGWTLSSAPYLFPDMAIITLLRAVGGSGTVLPAYVVFSYLSLAILIGWSVQRATQTGWTAWIGAVTFVNALLLWQPVSDHAHYLWLLGTVGFHGGAVLLGLANFALWSGSEDSEPSKVRLAVALGVFILGLLSDTLFLIQAVVPLGLGLWAQASWNWRRPRVQTYAKALLVSLVCVSVFRLTLFLEGWFNFSKVLRYVPTPAAISQAGSSFVRDLFATLIPGAWGLFFMALVAGAIAGVFWWRESRQNRPLNPAMGYALGGLVATTLMPIMTTYWRDANHVRYMLPWLVLPGWFALVWLLPKIRLYSSSCWSLAAFGMIFSGLVAMTLPQIQMTSLRWPYSESQAQLDRFLVTRGLRYGLSDYWRSHEINTLSRIPVRLFAVKPDGRVSFWNKNAFWFYGEKAGRLTVPDYTFIIADGLDEAALRLRFGEPAEQVKVGGFSLWLYSGPAVQALTCQIEKEVREFVHGRPGEERIALVP